MADRPDHLVAIPLSGLCRRLLWAEVAAPSQAYALSQLAEPLGYRSGAQLCQRHHLQLSYSLAGDSQLFPNLEQSTAAAVPDVIVEGYRRLRALHSFPTRRSRAPRHAPLR